VQVDIQLRVAVAEARDSSGNQRKGNQRLVKTEKKLYVCCSYNEHWSA
jgi:hypothetical protein